jgi:hypothetical protein
LSEVVSYLPRVWGQCQTFALSGLDGETDWRNPFVGQTLTQKTGLLFHSETDNSGDFRVVFGADVEGNLVEGTPDMCRPRVIGPDVLDLEICFSGDQTAHFKLTWFDKQAVIGEARGNRVIPCLVTNCPAYTKSELVGEGAAIVVPRAAIQVEGNSKIIRFMPGSGGKFAIIRGPDMPQVATAALGADLNALFEDHMSFYWELSLPKTRDEEILKTFVKACAIMKVNVETRCGKITNRWTTPDRWPHRHMWLWDSAFHSLGARHIDPELGRDCIRAVLTKQRSSGFIPHTLAPDHREDSDMTQPPVLSCATWELHALNPDRDFLAEVYPGLKEYLAWDLTNMDRLQTGLLQWQFPGPDSGMDNSPRFDKGPDFDALDLNCFTVNECQYLQSMAEEIGLEDEAQMWEKLRVGLIAKINDRLWNEKEGFYLDRRKNGSWVGVKTVDGFLPLTTGVATEDRARIIVEDHLTREEEFWPAFPVPSVALNEKTFELDMWRGPTWINYNWMIIRGLRRYDFDDVADEIETRSIGEISKWRSKRSSIYEFYDPLGKRSPQDLKRKGRIRRWPDDGIPVISDFFWSSALFVDMVAGKFGLESR